MAPYQSYKKQVKFARSRSPIPRKKASSADSYANIVLYYLCKLKKLFQYEPEPDKSPSKLRCHSGENYHVSNSLIKDRRISNSSDPKETAFEIVNAALQYGCANDIIEKVGNYFLVKNVNDIVCDKKIAMRRPTPGPDYVRCASCKNLAKFSSKKRKEMKVPNIGRSKSRRRPHFNNGRGHLNIRRNKRTRSNTSLVNYCAKCYARMTGPCKK